MGREVAGWAPALDQPYVLHGIDLPPHTPPSNRHLLTAILDFHVGGRIVRLARGGATPTARVYP